MQGTPQSGKPAVIRTTVRSTVLSRAALLGHLYRLARDKRSVTGPAWQTPFGFHFVGDRSMANGSFERDEIDLFLAQLEDASICLDIGANIGLYTCLAASRGKHVIAVEPLGRNLEVLYRNLLVNEFSDVEVFPVGLSSRNGLKHIFGTGTGASFLEGWAGSPKNLYQVVPVSTLDSIAGELPPKRSALIKVDVEGYELEVLRGAERTLGATPRPVWMIEICLNGHLNGARNEDFRRTFEIFWRHGYRVSIADAEQRPVDREDIERWTDQGFADFGSHNYMFQ